MISEKIQNLFRFIDHLSSYKNVLQTVGETCPLLYEKRAEYHQIKGDEDYIKSEKKRKVKQELDKITNAINDIHKTVVIIKINELQLCHYNEDSLGYHYYNIEVDIQQLCSNYTSEDILLIQAYASKYIEFRNECKEYCYCFSTFFDELDSITKRLFKYFKNDKINIMHSYNDFENKVTTVESIEDLIGIITNPSEGGKQKKISFPISEFIKTPISEKELKIDRTDYDKRLKNYLERYRLATENEFRLFEIQTTKDEIREYQNLKENPVRFFKTQREYENAMPFMIKRIVSNQNRQIAILQDYLERIECYNDGNTNSVLSKNLANRKQNKKPAEKWFALLYWFELLAYGENTPRTIECSFDKKKIIEYRINQGVKDGQSFYRAFIKIDINDMKLIDCEFGKNWRTELVNLTSDEKVIKCIQNK